MKSVLPTQTLIVVPFYQPWQRAADFQRQTCLRLAKKYHVIANLEYQGEFWLKKIWRQLRQPAATAPATSETSKSANLIFTAPVYFLPGKRWPLIRHWNQKIWLGWLSWQYRQFRPKWLWLFDPEAWTYPTALPGWLSVYDCVDDHSQIDPQATQRLQQQEKVLIQTATIFTVNSRTLTELHQLDRTPDAIVPQGFDDNLWPTQPPLQSTTISPTLSILGSLDERIDWSIVLWLAQHLPKVKLILAGPVDPSVIAQFNRCVRLPNVTYLGFLPRPQLAAAYTQTGIGLIPYNLQYAHARHSFPMKLLEYFAFGKPVVASRITELQYYQPLVTLAQSKADWLSAIQTLLNRPWPIATQKQQRKVALSHRYEKKLAQIEQLMTDR